MTETHSGSGIAIGIVLALSLVVLIPFLVITLALTWITGLTRLDTWR